jgi:hypothetical protein
MLTQGVVGGVIFAFRDQKINSINVDILHLQVDKANADK